jgi:hypothetical protein
LSISSSVKTVITPTNRTCSRGLVQAKISIMLESRYNKILMKRNDSLTPAEIEELITYIYFLRDQRNNLAEDYKKAIDKIVLLEERIKFLRSITQPRGV